MFAAWTAVSWTEDDWTEVERWCRGCGRRGVRPFLNTEAVSGRTRADSHAACSCCRTHRTSCRLYFGHPLFKSTPLRETREAREPPKSGRGTDGAGAVGRAGGSDWGNCAGQAGGMPGGIGWSD